MDPAGLRAQLQSYLVEGDLMITRYLSIGLAAALLAFGVYHWLLFTGLKHEIKNKDQEIAQYVKRIAFLEADNATLSKVNADFKAKVDEQNAALESLKREQDNARKQALAALAAAERRARQFERRANTLATAAPTTPEKLCESIDVKLNTYIEERQKELSGGAR
jgi:biopolymer transport protein ExbB/TolQ